MGDSKKQSKEESRAKAFLDEAYNYGLAAVKTHG